MLDERLVREEARMRVLLVTLAVLCGAAASGDERFTVAEVVQHLLLKSKQSHQVAWSAYVCGWQMQRAAALKEIATEHKYARIGGAVDLRAIHDLQDSVRECDEAIESGRDELRALKVALLPCSTKPVRRIGLCVYTGDGAPGEAECRENVVVMAYLQLLEEGDGLKPRTPAPGDEPDRAFINMRKAIDKPPARPESRGGGVSGP